MAGDSDITALVLSLTRTVTFHARHHYHGATADSIAAIHQDHGHLYRLEVTVAGPADSPSAMLVDLAALDSVIEERITTRLAGQDLNQVLDTVAQGSQQPSCEAIALWCWEQLQGSVPAPARLVRISVAEDGSLRAECAAAT